MPNNGAFNFLSIFPVLTKKKFFSYRKTFLLFLDLCFLNFLVLDILGFKVADLLKSSSNGSSVIEVEKNRSSCQILEIQVEHKDIEHCSMIVFSLEYHQELNIKVKNPFRSQA